MVTSPANPGVHRFGLFEFDSRSGELRKGGIRVRLEGQPVAILSMLLAKPRELVTREEIQKQLWADDTFVDFEQSLYAAIKRLRTALNDSAESPRYIETLSRRGYRFIAPLEATAAASEASVTVGEIAQTPKPVAPRWSKRHLALAVVLLLGGLAALVLRSRDKTGSLVSAPTVHSLAVLPLVNLSNDPEQEYFAEGMTDELITQLAKISSLRVISRTSAMRYQGTKKSPAQIAQELNVDALVEGSVVRSAERVRVTAQVIRANPEQHLWAESYDRPFGDLVVLQGELAREIAQAIRIQLTPDEQKYLASDRKVNRDAYEAFLKGRYFWGKRTDESTNKAIEYFQQATERDPGYALAYTGLADSYISLALSEALQELVPPNEAFPKARNAASRALELDGTSAEAHASLAHVKFQYDRDWIGAEKEFRRAIELNPNYANAHHWYALSLLWMGRPEDAIVEIKRAQELDPLSLVINANMGFILGAAQQYDRGIEQCRKTLEMDPNFALAHYRLGQILLLHGMNKEAIPELEKAIIFSGNSPRATAELGLAYARTGRKDEVRKLLDELKKMSKTRYVSPFDLAVIYGAIGEKSLALESLDRAYQERSPSLSVLNLSPAFTSIRSDQRFAHMVRLVGLPAQN